MDEIDKNINDIDLEIDAISRSSEMGGDEDLDTVDIMLLNAVDHLWDVISALPGPEQARMVAEWVFGQYGTDAREEIQERIATGSIAKIIASIF